jgi:chromosome segregation ATPase
MASKVLRRTAPESGEALDECELFPVPPRVVGPGRLERRYQTRVLELEQARADLAERAVALAQRAAGLERALDVAESLERGSGRLLDRLERDLERERASTQELHSAHKRLLLAVGALQRENQVLHGRLSALRDARTAALAAPRRAGWLARLLGRA